MAAKQSGTYTFSPRVVWTKTTRAKAPQRRPCSEPFVVEADRAWKRLRAVFAKLEAKLEAGVKRPPPNVGIIEIDVAGTKAALERLRSKSIPQEATDVMTEVCLSSVLSYTVWTGQEKKLSTSLVHYWLASSGVCRTIEILASLGARFWQTEARYIVARFVREEHQPLNAEKIDEEAWLILRRFLASANDATYSAALATAAKVWKRALVGVRCGLAYAFHDREDWADEAFAQCKSLEKKTGQAPTCAHLLFATRRDPKFLGRLQSLTEMYGDAPYAVIDALGPEALPLLCTRFASLVEEYRTKPRQRQAMQWMTLVESSEMASFMAQQLSLEHVRPQIHKYFERVPHLAILALEQRREPECKKLLGTLMKKYPGAAGAVRAMDRS